MNGFPFDVVVFDLDGTLADTAPDLAASLNHALKQLGREPIAPERVRHLVGHGAKALLRRGLAATGEASEALVEESYPHFMNHYGEHVCVGTRPFRGVEGAMERLAGRGTHLAVCTNKPERAALALIAALGWKHLFASVIGGDTTTARKPDPTPLREAIARAGGGRAVLVGDSIVDADTARAAGTKFVAVSFGFSDRPADQLGADAVIDDYETLVGTLERL